MGNHPASFILGSLDPKVGGSTQLFPVQSKREDPRIYRFSRTLACLPSSTRYFDGVSAAQLFLDLGVEADPRSGKSPKELRRVDAEIAPEFVRNERANRYIVRVQHSGRVRVTIPRNGNLRQARAFLERNIRWVAEKVAQHQSLSRPPRSWAQGTKILWRGQETPIRTSRNSLGPQFVIGSDSFGLDRLPENGDEFKNAVEFCMRQRAAIELRHRTLHLSTREGILVRRITIRSQRSRWGSCSSVGGISLNWRLIQAPPAVRDYVILHELMHTRVFSHSARFWSLVEQVCPRYREYECWIKQHSFLLEG